MQGVAGIQFVDDALDDAADRSAQHIDDDLALIGVDLGMQSRRHVELDGVQGLRRKRRRQLLVGARLVLDLVRDPACAAETGDRQVRLLQHGTDRRLEGACDHRQRGQRRPRDVAFDPAEEADRQLCRFCDLLEGKPLLFPGIADAPADIE